MVNRKEKSLYRLLPYGIVLVVILLLVIMPQENADFQSLVSSGISYQRGTVIQVLSQSLEESPLGSGMLGSQDLAVRLRDGSEVQMTNYLTDTHNILAEEGSKVIICVDAPDGVEPYYTVYNYDRTSALVLIFAVFILLMMLVGGKQGANAVLALAVSLLLIVRFTVPAIYRGGSPIAVGAITVFAATAVTLLLLHGATVRALLAAGVTLAGEGTACMLFAASSALLHVGGFQTDQAEGLLVVAQNTGLHLKTLLFAATMIASLGAVMDVGDFPAVCPVGTEAAGNAGRRPAVSLRHEHWQGHDRHHEQYPDLCLCRQCPGHHAEFDCIWRAVRAAIEF